MSEFTAALGLVQTERLGEIVAIDFDGRNPRQLTSHKSITINASAAGGPQLPGA